MSLFGCRACKAKDSEIAHLLVEVTKLHEHVEKAMARLTEAHAPGANARALARPRVAPVAATESAAKVIERKQAAPEAPLNFPGYERPEPADRYEVI